MDERKENNKMGRTNSFKTAAWFEGNDCDLEKRQTFEKIELIGEWIESTITIPEANVKTSTFIGV